MKLLDFVALYGFVLAPIGAIIAAEYFLGKKVGIIANYAEKNGISFNWAVFLAWGLSFGGFYLLSYSQDIFLSFLTLPAWLVCGGLYLLISRYYQKREITTT